MSLCVKKKKYCFVEGVFLTSFLRAGFQFGFCLLCAN